MTYIKWNNLTEDQKVAVTKYVTRGCGGVNCMDCPLYRPGNEIGTDIDCCILFDESAYGGYTTFVPAGCRELLQERLAEITENE